MPEGLFESPQHMLDDLKTYGFDDIRAEMLEKHGSHAEAAELFLKEGNHLKAFELFRRASNGTSDKRAVACLIDALWTCFPLGVSLTDTSHKTRSEELLVLASQVDPQDISAEQKAQVSWLRSTDNVI